MSIKSAINLISIVIPVYNEEENIREVYYQTKAVLSSLSLFYEMIFIDDGSEDRTFEVLKELQVKDSCLRIIKLAKNYGQLSAFLAGLEFTKGEIIITMDGDLQNNPNDILQLLTKIGEGFALVSGWRYNRKDTVLRKSISLFANWLIKAKTGVKLHDYGCAFTAVRREPIDKLKYYGRDARFIKPLLVSLANSITEVKVSHYPRKAGRSKYNLVKIIKLGLDFLFNFSLEPRERDNLPYIIEEVIGD